jgi:hypothetical protein
MTAAFSSTTSRRAPLGGAFIAVAALLGIVGSLADYLSAGPFGISLWKLLSMDGLPGGLIVGLMVILIGIAVMVIGALVALIANGRPGGVCGVFGGVLTLFGYAFFVIAGSQKLNVVEGHFADIAGPGSYLIAVSTSCTSSRSRPGMSSLRLTGSPPAQERTIRRNRCSPPDRAPISSSVIATALSHDRVPPVSSIHGLPGRANRPPKAAG